MLLVLLDSGEGESAVGKPESVDFKYTTRDVILYALGSKW